MSQEAKRAKWREYYRRRHPVTPARAFYHQSMGRIVVRDHYDTRIFWSHQMLQFLRQNYATMLNDELAEWLGVSVRTMIRKARQIGLHGSAACYNGGLIFDDNQQCESTKESKESK